MIVCLDFSCDWGLLRLGRDLDRLNIDRPGHFCSFDFVLLDFALFGVSNLSVWWADTAGHHGHGRPQGWRQNRPYPDLPIGKLHTFVSKHFRANAISTKNNQFTEYI